MIDRQRIRASISMMATLILLSLGAATPAHAAETLTLAAAANTVDTLTSEVIVREAYRRLGIEVIIKKYPGERALRLADAGRVTGDVQRIDGLSKKYRNLIQIKPPINFIEAAAFAHGSGIFVDGWNSLRPYRIGLIRGIKFAEQNTQGMKTYAAGDYTGLFRMLNDKRIDLAISPRLNGRYQIELLGIDGVTELRPAVDHFDLYHYVHMSRADLAAKLSVVFSEMAAAGQLDAIRKHVITVLLARAKSGLDLCDDTYACFEKDLTFLSRR